MSESDRDYILEENYLDAETCHKLQQYFVDNIGDKQATNVNPMFDNRVLYYEGIRDPEIKAIMKRIHEDVADKLSQFFKVVEPIYPEATHLVKWPTGTSLGNHADNAYEDGKPNYVSWRTHSAVVHLNDDFSGGEFYFKKNLPQTLPSKVGRLLAFTSGLDHVHGVLPITAGVRYALPMWFTTDRNRAYNEYK